MKAKRWFVRFLGFVCFLNLTIIVHELGHYTAAKAYGVHCTEFSVGFGPKITLFETGETKWTFGAIPILGAVHMLAHNGVDNEEGEKSAEPIVIQGKLLNELTPFQRTVVFAAGIIVNLLLAVGIILGIAVKYGVKPKQLLGLPLLLLHGAGVVIVNFFTCGRYPAKKQVSILISPPADEKSVEAAKQSDELRREDSSMTDAAAGKSALPPLKKPSALTERADNFAGAAFDRIPRWLQAFSFFAGINFVLGVFNLLPIPGLDGYWLFSSLFGTSVEAAASVLPDNLLEILIGVMVAQFVLTKYIVPRKVHTEVITVKDEAEAERVARNLD